MPSMIIRMLGTLMFLASFSSYAQYYYADLLAPPRQIIVKQDGISAGGKTVQARVCKSDSDYICFSTEALKFAVPRHIGDTRSWDFEDAKHTIKRHEKFSILGRPINVLFIDQVRNNEVTGFVYSEERGLLGISTKGKVGGFYLLENDCGFGAKMSCGKSAQNPKN